jgi:Flp pilus assembly protein TadG
MLRPTNPRQVSGRATACLRRHRKRRGAAVVEFALVLPLLCMIFYGMSEVCRAIMAKATLTDAVRKGCRTGIQRDKGNTDIFNDVVNVMRDNGYDVTKFNPPPPGTSAGPSNIGSVTITVTDPSGTILDDSLGAPMNSQVSVQVSIPVSSVLWVSWGFFPNSSIESDTLVMYKQ